MTEQNALEIIILLKNIATVLGVIAALLFVITVIVTIPPKS
jgi:hypothetical protein